MLVSIGNREEKALLLKPNLEILYVQEVGAAGHNKSERVKYQSIRRIAACSPGSILGCKRP